MYVLVIVLFKICSPVGIRLSMKTVADRFTVDPGNEPPREPAQKRKKTQTVSLPNTVALGLRGLTPPQLRLWAELGG